MSRNINLLSIPCNGSGAPGSSVENAVKVARTAASKGVDLLLLPEELNIHGHDISDWHSVAEPIPGPATHAFAELAREFGMYVCCPLLEVRDGQYWNSAPLLDRDGGLTGVYCKRFPFPPEIDCGTLPGAGPCVFTTDFGRAGFLICFDANYPEAGERPATEGAEIVLFPSMFNGGRLLQSLALHGGYYVLSATASLRNVLIDPLGRVIHQTREHPLAATVNLDYAVIHLDFQTDKIKRGRQLFGNEVSFEIDHDLGRALVVCHGKNLGIPEVFAELGLISCREYLRQSEERVRKARPPQTDGTTQR